MKILRNDHNNAAIAIPDKKRRISKRKDSWNSANEATLFDIIGKSSSLEKGLLEASLSLRKQYKECALRYHIKRMEEIDIQDASRNGEKWEPKEIEDLVKFVDTFSIVAIGLHNAKIKLKRSFAACKEAYYDHRKNYYKTDNHSDIQEVAKNSIRSKRKQKRHDFSKRAHKQEQKENIRENKHLLFPPIIYCPFPKISFEHELNACRILSNMRKGSNTATE